MSLARTALIAALLLSIGVPAAHVHAAESKKTPQSTETQTADIHLSLRSVTWMTRELRPGETDRSELLLPTMQMLSFDGRDLGTDGLRASLNAFMLGGKRGEVLSERESMELSHLLVGWRSSEGAVDLRAGRLTVFTGATRYAFLDGGAATVRLPMAMRLDVYGGTAAYEGFEQLFHAPVWGGRLAWAPWRFGHLGVAFQNVEAEEGLERRTVGVDLKVRALAPLRLDSAVAWDLLGDNLALARIDLGYRLNRWLDVYCRGEQRDALAWMPRTSIFTAFVAHNNTVAGLGFDLRTPGALSIGGGYDHYIDGLKGGGYSTWLNLRLRMDPRGRQTVGLRVARLDNGDNGYTQARLHGRATLTETLTASAELDAYLFDHPLHEVDTSVRGLLALRWRAWAGVRLGLDGQLFTDPRFTSQALGMLTLTIDEGLVHRLLHPEREPPKTQAARTTSPSARPSTWAMNNPGAHDAMWSAR